MDKTWVKLHRNSTEFKVGLQNFIQNSLNVASHEEKIKCPCRLCANRSWRSPGVVYKHMKAEGMFPDYADGFVSVNFKKLICDGDTLILASQAEQVFYVQDPIDTDWHVATKTKPRDLYNLIIDVHDDPCNAQNMDDASMDLDEENVRTDVDGYTINQALPPQPHIPYDDSEHTEYSGGDTDEDR